MTSTTRSFFLGMLSVFSFGKVRLFGTDEIDLEEEFKEMRPFAGDADAIASDWKNVGNDIKQAIEKYESKKLTQV